MGDSHTRLIAAKAPRTDDTLRTSLREVSGSIPPAVDALVEAGAKFEEAARVVRERARARAATGSRR